MTIAESLKRFRKEYNLYQKDVAEKLGVTPQAYQVYEKNVTPSAEVIVKIADAFNVSTDYLLGRIDKPRHEEYDEEEIKSAFALRDAFKSVIRDSFKQ